MNWLLNSYVYWRQVFQRGLLVLAALLLLQSAIAFPALATGTYEVSPPAEGTWIVDKAEVLSRTNEGKINAALDELATQTGVEVRFVTIHRLDYGETAQSFADALFKQWFPTPESQENQVLLVLDNVTNNVAIQTGAGVKAKLPDAIAESVAQETVLIPLKEGNKYNQALLGASDRLVAVLSGRPDPGPPAVKDTVQVEGTFATPEETKSSNATVWVIGFLIVATVVPMATYYFYVYMQSR